MEFLFSEARVRTVVSKKVARRICRLARQTIFTDEKTNKTFFF